MKELITMLTLVAWAVCVEIRLMRLEAYNKFLKDRIVDVDARMCIMEGSKDDH